MKINKKQKVKYIIAGAMLLLLALFMLFLFLRHNMLEKRQEEAQPVSAPITEIAVTAAPETLEIAGKAVEKYADSLDLSGVLLLAEDCSLIASMPNLTTLSLYGCGLTDVSFLSSLTGLKTLYLPDNKITNLQPLATLFLLSTLYLDNNPIADLSPLASFTGLTTLSLKGVEVVDYELEDLRNALPGCNVVSDSVKETARPVSIGGLAFTDDVETLDLSNRAVSDISKLSYCHKLTVLNLSGNPLANISVLSGLPSLVRLDLSSTDLQDEELLPLTALQNLQWLNLVGNPDLTAEALDAIQAALPYSDVQHDDVLYKLTFADRTFTSDCTEMDITACGATSLDGIGRFENLRRLIAYGNGLTNLAPLASLHNLEELDADYNNLSDITALNGQTALKKLSLAHNVITDIYALAGCTSLEELDVSYNSINYITHLENLTHLRILNLTGNPGVTADQIRYLQQMLPGCTILTDVELPDLIPEFTPSPEA